jgi:hypothetical protein
MPPINPALLKSGAQLVGRLTREAGKVAKAAPGLAETTSGAARLAAKTMSGLGGLSARLPQMPSGAAMQAGISGIRPRLQNAQLLAQLGQARQAAQAALQRPMAAAVTGSGRASQAVGDFLKALDAAQNHPATQFLASPELHQMIGDARTDLQSIHDMIGRFRSRLDRLRGEPASASASTATTSASTSSASASDAAFTTALTSQPSVVDDGPRPARP